MEDDIELKYRGGGSLIKRAPIFSADGLCVYIPCKNYIRTYSVTTGEKLQNYEGCKDVIVSAAVHPLDHDLLLACSVKGELATWKLKSMMLVSSKNIVENVEVNTFHLVTTDGGISYDILLSLVDGKSCNLNIYDLKSLKKKRHVITVTKHPIQVHVGGSIDNQFVAILDKRALFCKRLNDKKKKAVKLTVAEKWKATCAACHPTMDCVAAGNEHGQVYVWHNIFGNQPTKPATYHWHTLPVNVIMFSYMGSEMYTGGRECVLVKWQLDNVVNKKFLPRLAAPIVQLVAAPGNLHIAVATEDNALLMIDARLAVRQLVQELKWGAPFLAGLHVDARSKAVVLNGHVGNIQFYCPRTMSLLYNLDIVGQNKITDERDVKIQNTNVTKLSLSQTSEWLASIEERRDNQRFFEIRLKFFHFNEVNQNYTLNTSVEFPHDDGVNAIEFQRSSSKTDLFCVTSGGDKLFKIWNLVEVDKISYKSKVWRCYSSASYKELNAGPVSFSMDGSLLGAAFDSCLTLWKPDTCEFKYSLVHPSYKAPIHTIKFGNVDCCHLVVTCSESRMNVWNLLTLGLVRTVEVGVSLLCADPLSTNMAIFTRDNSLYVFSPGARSFEYERQALLPAGDVVLASCFVPHLHATVTNVSWQTQSQLYFVTSSQELLCLESRYESSEEDKLEYNSSLVHRSAFEALLAQTVSNKTTPSSHHKITNTGLADNIQIKELIQPPVHTMAPMRLLCASVLSSFIATEQNVKHPNATFFPGEGDMADESKSERSESKSDSGSECDRSSQSSSIKAIQIKKKKSRIRHESLKHVLNEPLAWTAILVD